ncbi:MAG: helix-turn-helix transcriptional regulator [Clostridia bacterium]|nr:helix-turn-helix transcriptional regulator [Clostridia bacterium]
MLAKLLKKYDMTLYQCAKLSGIAYTTLSEVVRGKTKLEKCSAETVYRLSKVFNVSMEELLRDKVEVRVDFEIFKSNICHLIKDNDEIDFMLNTINSDDIRRYWEKKWYPEAFYLLAMLDYLSRENEIPICNKYDDIRIHSLKTTIYPRDVEIIAKIDKNSDIKERSRRESIPEFIRFNIVESEVRNVY